MKEHVGNFFFVLLQKNTKMQMMNLRADGENGSTAKNPNQDAVIGQTFYSLLYRTVGGIPYSHCS